MFFRSAALMGLLALAAAICSQPAAAEDGGATTSINLRTLSNQAVRVHFTAGQGCLRLVSAGVRTRNASTPTAGGTITLPALPGPIVWAGLYWVILADTPPVNAVTLNATPVAPVALPVTASPCWAEISAFAYFADVTTIATGGANVVAGLDDSGLLGIGPESEGASLVVVYEDDATTACEIIVMDGNDLLAACDALVDNPMPVSCGPGLGATLHFIGGDGQSLPQADFHDNQFWNGVALGDTDDFDASDPGAPGTIAGIAWDTDTRPVVTGPPDMASVNSVLPGCDCIDWVVTAIEVDVRSCAIPVEEGSWGDIKSRYRD